MKGKGKGEEGRGEETVNMEAYRFTLKGIGECGEYGGLPFQKIALTYEGTGKKNVE